MTAYLILILEKVTDPQEMAEYGRKARLTNDPDAKPVVVYGRQEIMEGPVPQGVAMLEFPSMEKALAWYNGPAYQAALVHRRAGARSRVVIVDGVPPPADGRI